MNCENCPYNRSSKYVPPQVGTNGIVIISDFPRSHEIAWSKPFASSSGKLLRATLKDIDPTLSLDDFYLTHLVKCKPFDGEQPIKDAIQTCGNVTAREIKELNPKIIITLGNSVMQYFGGSRSLKIGSMHGKILKWNGIPILHTYHPSAMMYNPISYTDFVEDLKKAINFVYSNPVYYEVPEPKIKVLKNIHDLFNMFNYLKKYEYASLDIETTGLDPYTGEIVVIGIGIDKGRTWIIPPNVFNEPWFALSMNKCNTIFIGHNMKFDAKWLLYHLNIKLKTWRDTMLMHYLLDERTGGHGLKELTEQYFGIEDYSIAKECKGDFSQIPTSRLYKYLTKDCVYTYELFNIFNEELQEDRVEVDLDELTEFSKTFLYMELCGAKVNKDSLRDVAEKVTELLEPIKARLYDRAGEEFNPRSYPATLRILNSLGFNVKSTGKEVLAEIDDPIATDLTMYRTYSVIRSTFCEAFIKEINPVTGRIHSTFNLHTTVTGRTSSTKPNLQNIPQMVGPMVRNCFEVEDGYKMIEIDYSQLELRVAAMYSQDEVLVNAFAKGEDIHYATANAIFHKSPDEITKQERTIAKTINFQILYGGSAYSIAKSLDISVSEAEEYQRRMFGRFYGLKAWIDETQEKALRNGYVESMSGRRRRFPLITRQNENKIRRDAVNMPVQNFASWICVKQTTKFINWAIDNGLLCFRDKFNFRKQQVLAVNSVHDSANIECREDCIPTVVENARTIFPITIKGVEATVDIGIGDNWGKVKDI